MKKILSRIADFVWYRDHFIAVWLIPFSMIFTDFSRFRRFLYRIGIYKTEKLSVPVIIVGNISVGGTGKTPLVIWMAEILTQAGYKPGIITRGYAGDAEQWPQIVTADSNPDQIGDEAVLVAKNTRVPVAVGPSRVDAAKQLLEHSECNIIISDDGLQHYALARDIEIAVIDGQRRFGNGNCLPGGPLREPISRLLEVDLIVCNGEPEEENEFPMQLKGEIAVNLVTGEQKSLTQFAGQTCHALAGIGNPKRFFNMLEAAGLVCTTHSFPDHFSYQPDDINFGTNITVLMTEKDAVKCTRFALQNHWFVPVQATLPEAFKTQLLKLLKEKTNG
jgi:tetraacyldisaccharide 4'-kinase